MHFAKAEDQRQFDCATCKATTKKKNRCADPGFNNLPGKGMKVDPSGLSFNFCPGKATWYPEAGELFRACLVTQATGILPRRGSLEDQDELFVAVLPAFIERWAQRQYQRVWNDVSEFVTAVLKSVLGTK